MTSQNQLGIIRRSFTVELLRMIAGEGNGTPKMITTKNHLPEDAHMIHLSFDEKRHMVDMFFVSKEGQVLPEGANIYSIELSAPCFKVVETLDKQKVKESFKTIKECLAGEKGVTTKLMNLSVIEKQEEELGLK